MKVDIYTNRDTKYKAIIVNRVQGVIFLKYLTGPFEGTTFPIFENTFNLYWYK